MRVVSVGEGNVDCDDAHNPCGDTLHAHETNGVLLLPESNNRWHAFNVHTLLLPQHGLTVIQQVKQSTVATAFLALAKSGVTGTILMLGVALCVGFILLNMCGGSSEQSWENKQDSEPEASGSWAQTYQEARGGRRHAMDLLFKTGIIATQDLSLPYVNSTYIEECVQVAAQMLRERSIEEWVKSWEHAQQTFEDRLSDYYKGRVQDVMGAYEFSDGSWARAYRQSEGQRERREAFELLLRLSIISPDEFANSLVTPKYIEERLSVAMNLLTQKPLAQWVDLCETAHGNFKESVLACFTTQGGGEASQTRYPQEWKDDFPTPPREVTPPKSQKATPPREVKSQTLPVVDNFDKLHNAPSVGELAAEGLTMPQTEPVHGYHRSVTAPRTLTSPRGKSPRDTSPRMSTPTGGSTPTGRSTPTGSKGTAFVLPVGSSSSPQEPRTLPPTAGVMSTTPGRLPTPERPRAVNWPSSEKLGSSGGFGSMSRDRSPRTPGNASQGTPVQIMFSNSAISGSAWEASVTPPGSMRSVTPPLSQRHL